MGERWFFAGDFRGPRQEFLFALPEFLFERPFAVFLTAAGRLPSPGSLVFCGYVRNAVLKCIRL